ncbi:Uma2 family endonuclease [Thiococcus pfennigii]|uniref:Uma2 family endonuclease n=1 Tax=Thiococcus pfennigii TaxID=1057 RepID=UPI001908BC1A|nr:Uma2 family endonuclease [Thiococcus pfennigii]
MSGGFGSDVRLELLDGYIIDMSLQKSLHACAADLTEAALRECVSDGAYIRSQKPLALDDTSEPEPDIAVVPGSPRDYAERHPSDALLIVEVADSSLDFDRNRKARAYARNAIADYWIVNLRDLVVEVRRAPIGDAYQDVQMLRAGERIAPLAAPRCAIAIADLLPTRRHG